MSRTFLSERLLALMNHFPGTTELSVLKDPHGTYGMVIQSPTGRQYLFAAKDSMKGGTISVHRSLLQEALKLRVPIVLGIRQDFYRFSPTEIHQDPKSWENLFHGARMINFSIRLGHNVLKAPRPDAPPMPLNERQQHIEKAFPDLIGALKTEFGAVPDHSSST